MNVRKVFSQVVLTSLTACALCACGGGGGDTTPHAASSNTPASHAQAEVNENVGVPAGYALVWAEEFNGEGLPDSSKWSYDTEMNKAGWYHGELQYYAAGRLENSRVNDGKLIITARKEALTSEPDYGGQAYTSARLITRGKASWTYGFFEVRAKLPCGVGTWPAIWMLGTNEDEAIWPANGEIDIMEQVGKLPTEINATLHLTATAGTAGITGMTNVADACTNFHNYQLTWTKEALVIGVDNVAYHTYQNPGKGKDSWPYDSPQYLLLNLAIGGEMAGSIVDDSIFPRQMEVEYVRVYQKQ
jgi:beta-glucanase (GH16 family)